MTATDRILGLVSSVAIKAPCRLATTANITLNGLQSIDSVTTLSGDRVLVHNQTDATTNGIYVADTGDWVRDLDFDGTGDFVQGTMVGVVQGTLYNGTVWQLTTASPAIGSALAFAILGTGALSGVSTYIQTLLPALTAAAARTTLGAAGLTGDETIAGIKAFTGANTHAGAETHAGDESFTGKLKAAKPVVTGGASFTPQGRLTLATGVPVMISAQTGKTLVYYSPYSGNLIPIYDGTDVVATVFAEVSNDLTASSTGNAGPAAATTNSNYDLFVWNDSGTVRLTRGAPWTSDTARGTGAGTSELQRVNGIWTNKVAITNGPGANAGTYVGTIRTDGSSQANWQPGAVAANGTAALLNVWNAYSRIEMRGLVGDTTDSWTYTTATVRSANASATMRVSFLQGLQEDFFNGSYQTSAANTGSGLAAAVAGIGYDATNAFTGRFPLGASANVAGTGIAVSLGGDTSVQTLGFHFMQACEYSGATGTTTWYGDNGGTAQSGLTYHGRF